MTQLPFFGCVRTLPSLLFSISEASTAETTWLREYVIHVICLCGRGHPLEEEEEERQKLAGLQSALGIECKGAAHQFWTAQWQISTRYILIYIGEKNKTFSWRPLPYKALLPMLSQPQKNTDKLDINVPVGYPRMGMRFVAYFSFRVSVAYKENADPNFGTICGLKP